MSNKVLPALDKKLTAQVEAKIKGLLKLTGAMIISDGWTSIQARAIANALLATPAGTMFLQALDTYGTYHRPSRGWYVPRTMVRTMVCGN